MPQRIQRKRTPGWRMPEGAVYVGRRTKWGNPWRVGQIVKVETPSLNTLEWWLHREFLITPRAGRCPVPSCVHAGRRLDPHRTCRQGPDLLVPAVSPVSRRRAPRTRQLWGPVMTRLAVLIDRLCRWVENRGTKGVEHR